MAACRTAVLGGHLDVCDCCGDARPAYNSCRNRHCPKCQALAQERWIEARQQRVLPTRHFHVVFTVPSELHALVAYRRYDLLSALMRAAAETLLDLGSSRMNAMLGITAVLHTWTRDLCFHPHVHCVVTAGRTFEPTTGWLVCEPAELPPPSQGVRFAVSRQTVSRSATAIPNGKPQWLCPL
jgi:hypothetical protein